MIFPATIVAKSAAIIETSPSTTRSKSVGLLPSSQSLTDPPTTYVLKETLEKYSRTSTGKTSDKNCSVFKKLFFEVI